MVWFQNERAVAVKAEFLDLNELLELSDGHVNLQGRRAIIHSTHAFAQFRGDLLNMVGPEQARRIFTRFGYFWGQADAAAMKRIYNWDSVEDLLHAGPRLNAMAGIGRITLKALDFSLEDGRFLMEVYLHDSVEAEEHLTGVGRTDECACWKLSGYMSGFASACVGANVYFIVQQCQSSGDGFCYFVGRDAESWGDVLKAHLPYFEADDIKGRVERLTQELKRRTRELRRERQQRVLEDTRLDKSFAEFKSDVFRRIIQLAERVAKFDTSLLVTGETGVGKEVIARYIHRRSRRCDGPFVVVNCGALPETLLESELFGHIAGSFTDATHDRIGLFQQAEGGTILLDEIGDITPAMQLKILRVLQEKEITRVGENVPQQINVRVVAATNRDLSAAVARGKFREDLLYRLRVIELEVPPLRMRRSDILPLARFTVQLLAGKLDLPDLRLDAACVDHLQAYDWPGNIRELQNAIERAAVLSQDGVILAENLPAEILRAVAGGIRSGDPLTRSLDDFERDHIRTVLKLVQGNRTRAAKALGISQSTLWRKLKDMPEAAGTADDGEGM